MLASAQERGNLFLDGRSSGTSRSGIDTSRRLHRYSTSAVVDECRSFARENHEYGFWAGESEEDRHLLGYTVSAPIGIRARPSTARTF